MRELNEAFSRITPKKDLEDKILQCLEDEKMKPVKKRYKGMIALAACIAAVGITGAYAASPDFQEAVRSAISYFASNKASEISNRDALEMYNSAVGVSSEKNGYKLTVDNIATDDNFLHVFYTITSKQPVFSDNREIALPFFDYRADGNLLMYGANHNNADEYYVYDEYTIKGVSKLNISMYDLPERFTFEMYTGMSKMESVYDQLSDFCDGYFDDKDYIYDSQLNLTQEDIEHLWYVGTIVDKSSIKTKSVIKNTDVNLAWRNCNAIVEKVILSPFGNQLVIKTDGEPLMYFALFDDNGNSLDVLNTDLSFSDDGSVNSYEFLKAGLDTKAITIVPIKHKERNENSEEIENKVGTYPITMKTNDSGSIVITDIRNSGSRIEVDYYKDGFSLFDPALMLKDAEGNDICAKALLETKVNHKNNTYTASYLFDKQDANGRYIYEDESKVAELYSKIASISTFRDNGISLDFDNGVRIEIQ